MAERLRESADLIAGARVLDVATGSGNAAIAAARRECEVVGIDYGPTERAAAGLDASARAAMRVDLEGLAADANRLPTGGPVAIDAAYLEAIAVRA